MKSTTFRLLGTMLAVSAFVLVGRADAQTTQVPLGKLSRMNHNMVFKPVSPSAVDRPHPQAGGLTKPMSPTLAQPGWYVPRSNYSSGATSASSLATSKPGWYVSEGAQSRIIATRLGWHTPKATAKGDSSLAFNRPGWYLPENNLADSSGMLTKSSASAVPGQSAKRQAGRLGGSNMSGLAAGLSNVGGTPPTQVAATQQSHMTLQALQTSRRMAAGRFPYSSRNRIGGGMPSSSGSSGGSRMAGNSAQMQMMSSSWRTNTVFGQPERSIGGSPQSTGRR